MKKRIFTNFSLILLIGVLLLLTACGSTPVKSNDTIASIGTSIVQTKSSQQNNTVAIKDFKFDPQTIEISKGDTVVWKNEDSAPHTVTSDSFESGSMSQGDTFKHTFDTAGTFDYYCGNHPSMKGTVKVK
jgi:Plastocyanin